LGAWLTGSIAVGIIAGLVVGKAVGITGATWLVSRFTRAQLADQLGWWDVVGLSLLAGIGFTVSLLIGELAFGLGSEQDEDVKVGVLAGTLLAALLATAVLRLRNPRYRLMSQAEEIDTTPTASPTPSSTSTPAPAGPALPTPSVVRITPATSRVGRRG
jgi:Na+:H+ antiporter, NhaA family